MAISKELRDYITSKYNDKVNEVNRELSRAVAKSREDWSSEMNKKCEDIQKRFIEFARGIRDEIKDVGCAESSYFNYLVNNPKNNKVYYVPNLPTKMDAEVRKPFEDRIKEINAERDRVLVRLSLQKNFDEINAILSEYGIQL